MAGGAAPRGDVVSTQAGASLAEMLQHKAADGSQFGDINYPPAGYTSSAGGWFTLGAYHDANEYYSFPGAIDELKVWHVAQEPQIGCSPADSPDLNYYWMFDDNPVSLAQSDPRRAVMSTSAKLSEQTVACRSAHLPTAAR